METKLFGKIPDGEEIFLYSIKNELCELSVMSFGATIVSFKPYGVDIVAGFDEFDYYYADRSSHGGIVGRVANRILNAELNIDGAIHMLTANQAGNCLHGGMEGFARRVWSLCDMTENSITLSYFSEDGEEGFPGGLMTKVKYSLDGATLIIKYEAVPDMKTAINLTNHAFFNLDGFGKSALNAKCRIYADTYSEVNDRGTPSGIHPSVKGTVYDFSYPKRFGEGMSEGFSGHDRNYNLKPESYKEFMGKPIGLCAEVWGENLKMNYYTDQEGCQLYLANHIGREPGCPPFHGGTVQVPNGSYCFESQLEPNAVNHGRGIYEAGEVYRQITVYEVIKL